MVKTVEFYTQPNCPPCTMVEQFLDAHQIEYTTYDITEDNDAKNRLMFEYDSFSTPTLVVDTIVITGYNIEKLEKIFGIQG